MYIKVLAALFTIIREQTNDFFLRIASKCLIIIYIYKKKLSLTDIHSAVETNGVTKLKFSMFIADNHRSMVINNEDSNILYKSTKYLFIFMSFLKLKFLS